MLCHTTVVPTGTVAGFGENERSPLSPRTLMMMASAGSVGPSAGSVGAEEYPPQPVIPTVVATDFSPPVIDLAGRGFPLVGGRLDYLQGRPVAALVYQRNKHTINVLVSPDAAQGLDTVETYAVRGFHVRRWRSQGMSFWAVSDLNDDELSQFVRALRE